MELADPAGLAAARRRIGQDGDLASQRDRADRADERAILAAGALGGIKLPAGGYSTVSHLEVLRRGKTLRARGPLKRDCV